MEAEYPTLRQFLGPEEFAAACPRIPRARASFVIVYRRGFQVMRRDQEPERFRLLASLVAGRPLGAAVRAAIRGRGANPDRVARRLGRWFEEWAGAHLFVR
jgi:hypothetical protein